MNILRTAACAAIATLGFSLSAFAAPPTKMADGVLVDTKGMTLYTFDKDSGGKSVCNGQCLVNWPALMATAADKPEGDYTIITRDDGSKQWAYQGKPLYTWLKDTKPGDRTGDGVNNAWRVARP